MQSASGWRLSIAAAVLTACASQVQAVVTFEFTYFDTPGTGFNAPGSGDAFKFVLEDIAAEIGGFFAQTATVKIGVAPSEFDGTGFSASASATFLSFETAPPASGFFDGEVIKRIVNGEPHAGVSGGCGGLECDGGLVVDLGYTWSVDSTPGPTEIHFRSVMLHELTHILGYGSFIASDGTGLNGTTPDVYTKFDSFVVTGSGALIGPGGFPAFSPGAFPSILASGVFFAGPVTASMGGVALAASDPSHSAAVADVMFPTSPVGTVKDLWTISDFTVLEDLGYLFGTLLDGDYNGDGFVGVDDLNLVLVNWNTSPTPGDLLMGDGSGDGFVGVDDLNIVLVNWNAGTPPPSEASASIPEPGTGVLLGVVALAFVRRGGRYSRK
jgi:hypothetical protein